jgi:hypothetical protein
MTQRNSRMVEFLCDIVLSTASLKWSSFAVIGPVTAVTNELFGTSIKCGPKRLRAPPQGSFFGLDAAAAQLAASESTSRSVQVNGLPVVLELHKRRLSFKLLLATFLLGDCNPNGGHIFGRKLLRCSMRANRRCGPHVTNPDLCRLVNCERVKIIAKLGDRMSRRGRRRSGQAR